MRWDLSQGGQQYRVEARSSQGDLVDECRNYDSSCELQGLACGQLYTATVAAEDSDCISAPSDQVEIRTGEAKPITRNSHLVDKMQVNKDTGYNENPISFLF